MVAPPPQLVAAMQAAAQQGQATQQTMPGPNGQAMPAPQPRHAWDHVDEIVSILKTAFPLLALSMETFCDQVTQRFKQSADEDIYRLVNALLYDAFMVRGRRLPFWRKLMLAHSNIMRAL
jgi:transformation/transcription domain-associated protein